MQPRIKALTKKKRSNFSFPASVTRSKGKRPFPRNRAAMQLMMNGDYAPATPRSFPSPVSRQWSALPIQPFAAVFGGAGFWLAFRLIKCPFLSRWPTFHNHMHTQKRIHHTRTHTHRQTFARHTCQHCSHTLWHTHKHTLLVRAIFIWMDDTKGGRWLLVEDESAEGER